MDAYRQAWLLLTGAVLLTACERATEPEPTETSEPVAVLPVAEPPLDRAGLLLAVARAASDFSAGRDEQAAQQPLDGRRFEVRLRFGCEGEAVPSRQWSFDEQAGVLRVRVEPELAESGPAIEALGLEGFEAVEGFWIRRPWLLEASCPARPQAAASEDGEAVSDDADAEIGAPPPAPRIGIAHFFTAQDSRTLRRDSRAYEATVKLADGETPSSAGYDLVLTGRLAPLPDGRVIACTGDAASAPPRCIVSADFDGVRLTRPDGTVIAEWASG